MVVKLTKKQLRWLPPGGNEDLVAACERMDAKMLVKLVICVRITLKNEFLVALHHAPDPAALFLQVVKLFLSRKKFNSNKVWVKCVGLIRCLSMVPAKHSADTIEHAKLVAKDWKEMIDKTEHCGELNLLSAWGLLHFLISYSIVSEFDTHEIIRIFAMAPHKCQKNNTIELCKVLGLADRITDLIDYLIGNGQYLEVFYLAHAFKLKDKCSLLSLLKGCVEKAKQTAMEIFGNNTSWKSLQLATSKEVRNLQAAHHLAKQKIADSSQSIVIMAEIENLLGEYAKKRISACPSTAATWNSQCNPKKRKQHKRKRKKEEEHHEGQQSQQQPEQNQTKLIQGKQHQQINKKTIHN